jgi:hypothetical protein
MPVDAIVVVASLVQEGKWDVFFIQFPIYAARGAPSYESFSHFKSPNLLAEYDF